MMVRLCLNTHYKKVLAKLRLFDLRRLTVPDHLLRSGLLVRISTNGPIVQTSPSLFVKDSGSFWGI